ncbi:alpha/beta hydrolase [uncultured Clostridium sp.]|uniref:alpha/beta fold hydrolase n=1 Tax=uncultured Clostridium sp. TaxID=59620 RepID=UPI0025E1378A|nr:alpha/beta hydrolase [uncultured Clostridium sp.]
MDLIPESNGIKKVRMKKEITKVQRIKRFFIIVASIVLFGVFVQIISNFIGNETVSSSLYYAKIDSKKIEYKTGGSGDFTVVFDGAIGSILYQWSDICEKLEEDLGVKTFVYNRRGYGFSDSSSLETPEKQAENLKKLLRKAGVSGNLILVGEEYGSLVSSSFINLYPESVKGMVLINPYSEKELQTKEFKNDIKWTYYNSKVARLGTMIGVTMLLDKLDMTYEVESLVDKLPKSIAEEYRVKRNQKGYRQAISNELEVLYNYNGNSQKDNLAENIPLYIISKNENESLVSLGKEDLTTLYVSESENKVLSLSNEDAVINAITNVVKSARKIEKKLNG